MSKRIKIFDTTLRDGEQSPGASMSVDQKIELAITLDQLGVDRIEAGFPVSSPVQFEAVRKICAVVKNSTIVGLARSVEKDIDAAYESLKDAKSKMLHIFIATSPLHREFKLKKSKEQLLQIIGEKMDYARKFFDQIEFSAEDASRTEPDFLYEVIRKVIKHGATSVNVPDTVGYAIPSESAQFIAGIVENVPEIKEIDLSVHCHNDLGLAVANSVASVMNGATQVEVTLNGIGERAGNCSLEELVMAFDVRKDLLNYSTGIKKELIYPASKLLENITGLIIPRNKPIIGDNAFAHESGIHQDGYLKHKGTYEIMKPETIGRSPDALVMGRHSGKHAFKKKLEQYNMRLTSEQFDQAFEKFTEIADKKKEVFDEDIFTIVSSILGEMPKGYHLEYFHTFTGNTLLPTATVKLKKEDQEFVASSVGDGPLDAVFQSTDAALGINPILKDYMIHSVGAGKDAQAQVKIILEFDGEDYIGKGSSTDIVEASALAYINAVNKRLLMGDQKAITPEDEVEL